MSSPQPPDRYRNNKPQRSLNTSNQIPGTMLPSGSMVNKRLRSQLPTDVGSDSVANAPGDLAARPAELCQQLDDLGLSVFSRVIIEVKDVVSSVKKNQDHEAKTEEICDLCDQVAIRVIETFKEGKAMSMIKNTVETMTRNLQSTVTEYQRKCAEARCHPDLEEGIRTNFLESVTHLLEQSVELMSHNGTEERDGMKETILSMSRDTGDTLEVVKRIHAGTINIQQTMSSSRDESMSSKADEAVLNAIQSRVDSARYNFVSQTSSSFCLLETRVALLKDIEKWANEPSSRPIFWLCGMAGTGKTTIARTVAKRLDESNYLGASFFFSRDENDRRTTNLVFPSIAHQLARRIPSIRKHIIEAATSDVCTAMMQTQLNKLIVEPLQRAKPQSSPLVIVMDALDECAEEDQITEMLVLLAPAIRVIQETINIRLFVTSRPEVHISSEFKEPGMEVVSSVSVLHDIEKSLVRADINRYIEHHLQRIAKLMLPRTNDWPASEEKEALVDMADGLFIFASVTIGYVGDKKHRQPIQRLRKILSSPDSNQTSVSLKHLDTLYRQIFMASLPNNDEDEDAEETFQRIRELLGTVVLVLYPLSSSSLERLIEWEKDTVEPILSPFHSVLSIPPDPAPVRVFHKSFPDFLTDKKRSGDLYIDPTEHHARIALLCLTHMNSVLQRDMCGVGSRLVSEINDTETILATKVQGHVLYACRYWAAHLIEATWSVELGAALKQFCDNKFLYWLEILCLDRKLGSGILALDSARKWTQDESSSATLYNGYRYLLYHHNTIARGPSYIYQSTLPFIPHKNLSTSPWVRELHSSPRVVMTNDHDGWNRILFNLSGHSEDLHKPRAVAYSPDGTLIATSSFEQTIIVWDSRTGGQIRTLRCDSERVTALGFSPDGRLIASGDNGGVVSIWNSMTGIAIHTLKGHSGEVHAVLFCPHQDIVASTSRDATFTLWSSVTGSLIWTFNSRISAPDSLISSLDGRISSLDGRISSLGRLISILRRLISGLDGRISSIGNDISSLPHRISSLDGHISILRGLISGFDGRISSVGSRISSLPHRISSVGGRISILRGRIPTLNRLTSTLDSLITTLDSDSSTLDSDSSTLDSLITTLDSDSWTLDSDSWILDRLIYTLDSRRTLDSLISTLDSLISTLDSLPSNLDSLTSTLDSLIYSHPIWVPWIAFSHDGAQIVSMTSDLVFIVWDTETGRMISMLKENSLNAGTTISAMHGDIKFPVAFSPDGTQLASAFGTEVILWDYPSLTGTRHLQLNEDRINCIAFSPDGRYLIGGGDRGQLIIWDITNGLQIDTFRAHLGPVESMAISPDGLRIITCDGSDSPVVSDMSSGWGKITDPEGKIDTDTVECVAFSSDGSKLAYGTKDATVVVWDIGRHAVIHALKGHGKSVATVAFSIDGKYLASGSESGLIVWNVQDEGKVIKPFDPAQKVAFSRDGLYLVAQCQYFISSRPGYCKWSTEDLAQCRTVNITWEQAKHDLKGSPAIVDPLSGTYLARRSQWVEKRYLGTTMERLCLLPHQDITASASFGRYFAFGTKRGKFYLLDFPPNIFGITSKAMCTDQKMVDL